MDAADDVWVCVCVCVNFRGSTSPLKPGNFSDSSSNPPFLAASRRPSLPPSPAASLRAIANAVNLRRNSERSAPDLSFSGSSSIAIYASHRRSLQESATKQLYSYQDNFPYHFSPAKPPGAAFATNLPGDVEEPTVKVPYCTCRAQ